MVLFYRRDDNSNLTGLFSPNIAIASSPKPARARAGVVESEGSATNFMIHFFFVDNWDLLSIFYSDYRTDICALRVKEFVGISIFLYF